MLRKLIDKLHLQIQQQHLLLQWNLSKLDSRMFRLHSSIFKWKLKLIQVLPVKLKMF